MFSFVSFTNWYWINSVRMASDRIYRHNMRNLLSVQCNIKDTYENAIEKLNNFQSNSAVLKENQQKLKQGITSESPLKTEMFLKRIGITVQQLESELSVIHVSGTKGKGSTCAYCESILRHHGYKTGFFSSPHLVAVRERIRINGQPISESKFTSYFWDICRKLEANKNDYGGSMPFYFKFLTVMAFNVFIKEKVDVAIIEVGIGGEEDSTNFLRNTPIVGITSLGLDHMELLGHSLDKIAWQKAGIMKKGCIAITACHQPSIALNVLYERAREKECVLVEAPTFDEYKSQNDLEMINLNGTIYETNASLGLQLAYAWLAKCKSCGNLDNIGKGFYLNKEYLLGVENFIWPGRQQILSKNNGSSKYFIDGAHTLESMEYCSLWFKSQLNGNKTLRVLVFNITKDRDPSSLLKPLMDCDFDVALFCTNSPHSNVSLSSDQANLMCTNNEQLRKCLANERAWIKLNDRYKGGNKRFSKVFSNVKETIMFIENLSCEVNVLVTGSLYLVGAVLSIIDPDLILSNNLVRSKKITNSL